MRVTPRILAALLFAALVTLCGIGVHLVAELVGLGWRADAGLIVSREHIPLGLLGLAAVAALGMVGVAIGSFPDRDRAITAIVDALPDRGCGLRFLSFAFGAQVFVFAVTETEEGMPLHAGDLGLGLLAAFCASAIGALLVRRYPRSVIEAISGLLDGFVAIAVASGTAKSWRRREVHVRARRCRAIVFAGSRRPPPFGPCDRPR